MFTLSLLLKILSKEELKSKDKENKENLAFEAPQQELWVERYRPKNYCQLLSDEVMSAFIYEY